MDDSTEFCGCSPFTVDLPPTVTAVDVRAFLEREYENSADPQVSIDWEEKVPKYSAGALDLRDQIIHIEGDAASGYTFNPNHSVDRLRVKCWEKPSTTQIEIGHTYRWAHPVSQRLARRLREEFLPLVPVNELPHRRKMKTYTAKKRLYVNADYSAIVPPDHPDVAFLLAAEGGKVPISQARQLGLLRKGITEAELEAEYRHRRPLLKRQIPLNTSGKRLTTFLRTLSADHAASPTGSVRVLEGWGPDSTLKVRIKIGDGGAQHQATLRLLEWDDAHTDLIIESWEPDAFTILCEALDEALRQTPWLSGQPQMKDLAPLELMPEKALHEWLDGPPIGRRPRIEVFGLAFLYANHPELTDEKRCKALQIDRGMMREYKKSAAGSRVDAGAGTTDSARPGGQVTSPIPRHPIWLCNGLTQHPASTRMPAAARLIR